MKKYFILLILSVILISCSNNAKFTGEINIHFEKGIKNKEPYQEIIETRLERLDIKKFKIEELSDGFSIKLPKISDTTMVFEMLKMDDKLGFWETYENPEVYPWLEKLNNLLASQMPKDTTKDSTETLYPLFSKLQLNIYMGDDQMTYLSKGSTIGFAKENDTSAINAFLNTGMDAYILPRQMVCMWGELNDKGLLPLYALKIDEFTKGPFMENGVVKTSRIIKNEQGSPDKILALTLTEDGGRIFKSYTGKNIGKEIAITFASFVIMSPRVESEIKGGKVNISAKEEKFLKFLQYALKMPLYPTHPISITHHFELRK